MHFIPSIADSSTSLHLCEQELKATDSNPFSSYKLIHSNGSTAEVILSFSVCHPLYVLSVHELCNVGVVCMHSGMRAGCNCDTLASV
jgi:hypothetical protein